MLIAVAVVLAAIFVSGCGTTENSARSTGEKYWELGSRVGDTPGKFKIYRGSSQLVVRGLLGEPNQKKPSANGPQTEEWIYERHVEFGYAQKGMNVGTGRVNSCQRQRYSETARIVFKDAQVNDIRVVRYPEDIEGDPLRGMGM